MFNFKNKKENICPRFFIESPSATPYICHFDQDCDLELIDFKKIIDLLLEYSKDEENISSMIYECLDALDPQEDKVSVFQGLLANYHEHIVPDNSNDSSEDIMEL